MQMFYGLICTESGRVVQSVAHLTQESEVPGSIPGPATYFHPLSSIQKGQLSANGESMCTWY